VRFERIVRPAHAGILVAYYDPLPCEARRPDLWSIHILDAPLDDKRNTRRNAKVRNRWIFDPTSRSIGIHARHVRTSSEGLYQRAVCCSDQHVNHPERLVSYPSGPEEIFKADLSPGGMLTQGVVDEPTLRVLVFDGVASVGVSLVGKDDEDRCAPAVCCISKYLRRDLARRSNSAYLRMALTCRCPWLCRGFVKGKQQNRRCRE
jgi:hypothetical protein